jgi:hypothetical protein
VSAYEEAQRRQLKGALLEAREQALECANAACPAEVVSFCSDIANDLDNTIPTIVVAVTDHEGKNVAGARLVVDGKEPGRPLDGRPVPLDPGPHRLRLVPSSPDAEPAELDVTLHAGERNRRIEARLANRKAKKREDASSSSGSGSSSLTVAAAIVFGVGGTGLVVGAVTGGMALAEDSNLADLCDTPTTCPVEEQGRIDRAKSLGVASTTAFVIGAAGAAVGLVLVIVGVTRSEDAPISASARGLVVRF